MILRPRQREFVTRCVGALKTHGNTLGVAPTGAGKTICLSGTAGEFLAHPDAKACVLAHRDELTAQNQSKFSRVNPGISTSVFDARQKSWAGQATFAMVQTLARNLDQLPTLDLLVIDEAHHSAAPTYRQVIDAPTPRKNNPRSNPLNGAISPSNSWRNSELANTTPAIKAPRAGLKPTNCIE